MDAAGGGVDVALEEVEGGADTLSTVTVVAEDGWMIVRWKRVGMVDAS